MSTRVLLTALGIVWIALGYSLLDEGSYYSWRFGRVIDFGGFGRPVGAVFMLVGAGFLCAVWLRKRRNEPHGQD